MTMATRAHVTSVNLARMRLLMLNGAPVKTGIFKEPVGGRTAVGPEGLESDQQADREVHGGLDKAVYAYSAEDYRWWSEQLGTELEPGRFGENLTVEGLDPSHAVIGERWRVGSALLEISEPRLPCSKLAAKMGDPKFVRRFAKALRLGAYLRVIETGEVAQGDAIEILERPDHGVTMELMGRSALEDRGLAAAVLEAPALSAAWRAWAEERAAKTA